MALKYLVLFGPPGSGKGTQAVRLRNALGVPHISTGEILRDHIGRGTKLGRLAKPYAESGGLVPDGPMIALVRERLSGPDAGPGFLLDGFPPGGSPGRDSGRAGRPA
jgi:adenylate kinase